VPTPATTLLLTGYPWHDDGIGGERVTPTGGAILRHLVPPAQCNARRAAGRLIRVGSGAGTRTLAGLPNIVRVTVTELAQVSGTDIDVVAVVEFDVDDMTGEEIAVAADRLRTEVGVLDVSVATRHGKKGPSTGGIPAARTTRSDRRDRGGVLHRNLDAGTALGARSAGACCAEPKWPRALDGDQVAVKVAQRPGGKRTAEGGHDDVVSMPGLGPRRERRAAAVKGVLEGG
jgi:uncharacterized protein (DUF111 family)